MLFRAASNSASLEIALTRRNIPFRKYGGLRFLETAHVKDLISILRILENPRDEIAWFRVLQLLSGVGPKTAASAFSHVEENGFGPRSLASFQAPPGARSGLASLAQLIEDVSTGEDSSLAVQFDRVSRFYLPLLESNYEDPVPRKNDIEHLGELAVRYPSRRQFLAELVLEPPMSTGDFAGSPFLDEDWLVLSTIHSAKGLEWDAVYLIAAADGCLPSDLATGDDDEIEEELRLTYVAMTRARDFLYVLWPLRFYTRSFADCHVYAQMCRFFTPEVLDTMDSIACQDAKQGEDEHTPDMTDHGIMDKVKEMWG